MGTSRASADIGGEGKKMGGNSPTSTQSAPNRRLPGQRVNITPDAGWMQAVDRPFCSLPHQSRIGNHSSIPPAGSAVTIEGRPVMSRAPCRGADGSNTQPVRLIGEDGTKVQMPRPRPVDGDTTAGHNLRANLI